ncbi:hypothetical protein NPIL_594711 [Nephila pilipes]|uniref:Uncharacterized protein n=1 Tax=Nephila pilipes TaxID=299642 RepID=A0A8X6US06_NEPPI|nr:hypothetical protein NPIL_594711 [Nephila pilipes]
MYRDEQSEIASEQEIKERKGAIVIHSALFLTIMNLGWKKRAQLLSFPLAGAGLARRWIVAGDFSFLWVVLLFREGGLEEMR